MLFTQISLEETESGVLDGSDFIEFGDFDVLDYAATPQVSPSAIINSILNSRDEEVGPVKSPVLDHCKKLPRYRRDSHVRAEKKRRNKIQDQLRNLHGAVPTLRPLNDFQKLSELETIVEAGKYIKEIRSGQADRLTQLEQLRAEKEKLKSEFDHFQNALPTSGIQKEEHQATLDDRYSCYRTEMVCRDWKFAIFDRLVGDNLFKTYVQQTGSENSPSGYIKSLMAWTESTLCLTSLRPVIISGVRDIATNTSCLRRPDLLRKEITQYPQHHTLPSTGIQTTPCTVTETERKTELEQKHGTKRRPLSATITATSTINSSLDDKVEIPKLQVSKRNKLDQSEETGSGNPVVPATENIHSSDVEEVEILAVENYNKSHNGQSEVSDSGNPVVPGTKAIHSSDFEEVKIVAVHNVRKSNSDSSEGLNTNTTTVSKSGNIIPIFSSFDSLDFLYPSMEVIGQSVSFGHVTSTAVESRCLGFTPNVVLTSAVDASREET